jgi:hypothetical protein
MKANQRVRKKKSPRGRERNVKKVANIHLH